MRVLMIVSDFPPMVFGGIAVYAEGVATELVKKGIDVDVYVIGMDNVLTTDQYDTEKPLRTERSELTVYRFKTIPIPEEWKTLSASVRFNLLVGASNAYAITQLLRLAGTKRYDVIHTNDFFGVMMAHALREQLRIPIVNVVHATGFYAEVMSFQLREYACLTADKNIFISQYVCDYLRKYLPQGSHLHKIEGPIVFNGVSFWEATKAEVLDNTHDVLMAGAIKFSKGCFMMLKAFLELYNAHEIPEDSRLLYAGKGEDVPALQAYIAENHLEERVVYLGSLPYNSVRELMHKVCVLAALGQHEAFGLTALEAMAENTCVIASDCYGFKEYMTNEYDSLLVDPYSVDEIKAALKRVLNDADFRAKLIQNGEKTATKWSWAETASQTLEVYNRCIEEWEANGNRTISYLTKLREKNVRFDLQAFMKG